MSRTRRTWIAIAGLLATCSLLPPRSYAQGPAVVAADQPEGPPRVLILSDQARRFLALQYRAFPTEFMGCMIGVVRGRAVLVERIAPADVDPAQSTATWVVPRQSCEDAGWSGTVGTIHSHPTAQKCWYFFPGTSVPSADGQSFLMTPYAVDAIMCGERIVWINRTLHQGELVLSPPRSPG
jgi:JAB domain-containing protein similar to deubiquitination enzymes